MSDEEDAEPQKGYTPIRVHLKRRPDGVVGFASVIIGWGIGTMDVLNSMHRELDPIQFNLAFRIFEHWSKVMPFVITGGSIPRILAGKEIGEFKTFFDEVDVLCGLVRIVRPLLPHAEENEERDELIITEARAYCEERLEAIRRMPEEEFEVQKWVYGELVRHIRQLLYVALGDEHMEQFDGKYDLMIEDLKTQIRLNQTPVN